MTSSEENVTTSPEPETIEVQTMRPSPDGFHPRSGARRRTAILVAANAVGVLAVLNYSHIPLPGVAEARLTQRTEEAGLTNAAVLLSEEDVPTHEIILDPKTASFSVT